MLQSKNGIFLAILISVGLFGFLAWWVYSTKKQYGVQFDILRKLIDDHSQKIQFVEQQHLQQQQRLQHLQQQQFIPPQFMPSMMFGPPAGDVQPAQPAQPAQPVQPVVEETPTPVPTETPDELDELLKAELAELLVPAEQPEQPEPKPAAVTKPEEAVYEELSTDAALLKKSTP